MCGMEHYPTFKLYNRNLISYCALCKFTLFLELKWGIIMYKQNCINIRDTMLTIVILFPDPSYGRLIFIEYDFFAILQWNISKAPLDFQLTVSLFFGLRTTACKFWSTGSPSWVKWKAFFFGEGVGKCGLISTSLIASDSTRAFVKSD